MRVTRRRRCRSRAGDAAPRRRGTLLGEALGDLAGADEAGQGGVHRLHAEARPGLHGRGDLVRLALADEVAHGRRGHEHLAGHDAARAIGRGQQLLGHDAHERDRELDADLVLLVSREDVDRLRRALGVQRGEDEVAGLGRGQGGGDGVEVAHLADEDHVGVLAQGGLEGQPEGRGVGADLALVDDALLVAVQELDRVLDGHDVLFARRVDLVDHRGQRGGLAGAGRARDEHEPTRLLAEVVDDGRQPQVVDRRDDRWDQAEGGAQRRALEVRVDAEAGLAGDRVSEVDLPVRLQALALIVREDPVDDLAGVRGHQLRVVLERDQAAADADHRL
jgi:hypothetical protein